MVKKVLFVLITGIIQLAAIPRLYADNFVVTSNADSGPGTLRDALDKAAANGTATQDIISFNLPDISRAGRTIIINSRLPPLTSNLVIDGSTQAGDPIAKSQAKVTIEVNTEVQMFPILHCQQAEKIEIYGLFLYHSFWQFGGIEWNVMGIYFNGCRNITIGKPGKGNWIRGCKYGIISAGIDYSSDITIQSNLIGIDEDGKPTNYVNGQTSAVDAMEFGLFLPACGNILIGGDADAEGNTIFSARVAISSPNATNNGFVKILRNRFNSDINGYFDPVYYYGARAPIEIFGLNTSVDYEVTILNNIIVGTIYLNSLTKYFKIQGNKVLIDITGSAGIHMVSVYNSPQGGLIGGDLDSEANEIYALRNPFIYYFVTPTFVGSVYNIETPRLTIRKNIMHCNGFAGSSINHNNISISPYIRIDQTNPGFVKGKATPGCTIDVYLDDECMACEGRSYLGKTTSAADSTWSFTGSFAGVIVATATNTIGTTSGFSQPVYLNKAVIVQQPTCGLNNGSIKGMQIGESADGQEWHLVFSRGGSLIDSIVGTTLDVDHLAPGDYYFHAKLGATCRSYHDLYKLRNIDLTIDVNGVQLTQPSCGNFNGSILNVRVTGINGSGATWYNESGQIFPGELNGEYASVKNLGPGKYYLVVKDVTGVCTRTTPVYELINQSGPSININSIQINPSSCSNSNGSIKNILATNITGSPFIQWLDSLGETVGNTLDLINQPAGKYKMKFKDQGSCDTITTPYFIIPNNGTVLDSTHLIIKPSGCNLNNGSIKGLIVTGATSVQWIDVSTGNVVSNSADLLNVGAGTYRFVVTNTVYGCSVQSGIYSVLNAVPVPLIATNVSGVMASCNLNNASVNIIALNVNTANYTFKWLKDSTTIVANGLHLDDVGPGRYQCIATDANGCQQQVYAVTIIMLPLPTIDVSRLQVKPDTCNLSVGSINGLSVVSDKPGVQYAWYNDAGQLSGNSQALTGISQGSYHLTATDIRKCTVTSDVYIVGNVTKIVSPPQYDNVVIPKGAAISLIPKNAPAGTYLLYNSPAASTPVQQNNTGIFPLPNVDNDVTYYIAFKSGDCVSNSIPVTIKVVAETKMVVPNAFTPNGDRINKTWGIKIIGLAKLLYVRVYNRWGQLVFETSDLNQRWDGTFRGKPVPQGSYVYMASALDYFGNPLFQKGLVSIFY